MITFFQHKGSWKTGKAVSAVGCSFLCLSLLEVTDYPQLATPEFVSILPVPEPRVHQPRLVPWVSTLVSHGQYGKYAPLFISRD